MNAPRTDTVVVSFAVPCARIDEAMRVMKEMGFAPALDGTPWREALPYRDADLPGVNLAGARYREGLTQARLASLTGISRRHISEMENGRRAIGRQNAQKLGLALNVDPRFLLTTP